MAYPKKDPNMINFGKYRGQTYQDVATTDPDYLVWMKSQIDPADLKNNGKYAKANQERIVLIDKVLGGLVGGAKTTAPAPAKPTPVALDKRFFDSMLALLVTIDGKLDKVLGASNHTTETSVQEDENYIE